MTIETAKLVKAWAIAFLILGRAATTWGEAARVWGAPGPRRSMAVAMFMGLTFGVLVVAVTPGETYPAGTGPPSGQATAPPMESPSTAPEQAEPPLDSPEQPLMDAGTREITPVPGFAPSYRHREGWFQRRARGGYLRVR